MLEEIPPHLEIVDGVDGDGGELSLRKIFRRMIRSTSSCWYYNRGMTHILAYTIPYTKMCLAVREKTTSFDRLVVFAVYSFRLPEILAELDSDIDDRFLMGKV
jgi:hypothetical protein